MIHAFYTSIHFYTLMYLHGPGVISRSVVSRSAYRGASTAPFLRFHLGAGSIEACLFVADCVCPDGLRAVFLSTRHESHVGHPPPHGHAHATTIIIIILTSSTYHHHHHPPHTTILHRVCTTIRHPAMFQFIACIWGVLRSISEISCRCFGLLSINA